VKAISGAFAAALLVLSPMSAVAAAGSIALAPQAVTPHVYVIPWPAAGADRNTTVIEQSDGLAVVDPVPTAWAGRRLVGAIRKLSPKPVKYLIYTHGRGRDPVARMFVKLWPRLTIVATDTARDDMSGAPMNYIRAYAHDYAGEIALAREQLKRADLLPEMRSDWRRLVDAGKSIVSRYSNMKSYLATLTFSDRLDLPDPETPVEVLYLERVNSNGSAVVWAPTERALYTGDIAERAPYAASDPLSWVRLLDRVAAYDYAYLIPEHGDVQTDRAYLDKTKATVVKVMDEMTPLTRTGAALAHAYKEGDLGSLMAALSGGGARRKQGVGAPSSQTDLQTNGEAG
jgi:glyoxylase-like metal-dependent hydrolase (beta-lactamase superfamily II)